MASAEDPILRQEIQSSLKSIIESADKWLERLKKRQFRVRLATSFLTTILIFAAIGASVLIFLFTRGLLTNFGPPPRQIFPFIGLSALFALICGNATYFFLKRKHDAELKDLSTLISQMKKVNEGSVVGITEDALSLADKIVTLLPELVRKRSQDSLLFGVVAFILGGVFTRNPIAGVIIGVVVWLYFRHETRRTYQQEISKLEEQKRVFEQRKKDFIETL